MPSPPCLSHLPPAFLSTGSFIMWLHVPPPPTCSFILKNLSVASLENLTDSAKSELNAFSYCPHIPLFTAHGSSHIKPLSWLPYLGAFKFFFFSFLIWLHWVLVVALRIFDLRCSMWDLAPWPGSNSGLLQWEEGVLATGPLGKSLGAFS